MVATDSTIHELPPSAKLVLKVLEYNGQLTQKQIVEESLLSPRTVRHALGRLQDQDVVLEKHYLQDARQNLYQISPDIEGEGYDVTRVARPGLDSRTPGE